MTYFNETTHEMLDDNAVLDTHMTRKRKTR